MLFAATCGTPLVLVMQDAYTFITVRQNVSVLQMRRLREIVRDEAISLILSAT